MPDATTAETPKIQKTDVLLHGVNKAKGYDATTASRPDLIKQAAKRSEEFDKAHEQDPEKNVKAELAQRTVVKRFTKDDLAALQKSLGIKDTDTDLYVKGVQTLVDYLEVAEKAARERVTPSFSRINEVVDFITQNSALLDRFPDLADLKNSSPTEFNEVFRSVIAVDPVLRDKLASRFKLIKEDADKRLPEDKINTDLSKLKKDESTLTALKSTLLTSLKTTLGTEGLTPDQLKQLEDLFEAGVDPGTIHTQILEALIDIKGIRKDQKDIEGYIINESQIADGNTRLPQAENERSRMRTGGGKGGGGVTDEQIRAKEAEIAKIEANVKAAEGRRDAHKAAVLAGSEDEAVFTNKLQSYYRVASLMQENSSVSKFVTNLSGTETKLSEVTGKINEITSDPDIAAKEKSREEIRKDLQQQFQDAVAEAISDFLEQKYENYDSDLKIKLRVEATEAKKAGDKWKENATKTLKKVLSTRWIKRDEKTREKQADNAQIGEDVRKLAYNGEDGLREITASSISFTLDDDKAKNDIAVSLGHTRTTTVVDGKTVDTTYSSLSDQDKITVDTRRKQEKENFEEFYGAHRDTIVTKLLADFGEARGRMGIKDRALFGKISMGKLALTNNEWAMLKANFESVMENITSSKGCQKALKDLESKGIKPDSKLKWLLYLLLALGGAAALGTAGAAGVPLAGMAAGAFGK